MDFNCVWIQCELHVYELIVSEIFVYNLHVYLFDWVLSGTFYSHFPYITPPRLKQYLDKLFLSERIFVNGHSPPSNYCTVPNLEGDPKFSKRGPKGDLILSKKGT